MYQSRPVHRHGRLSNVLSRRSTSRVTVWCCFRDRRRIFSFRSGSIVRSGPSTSNQRSLAVSATESRTQELARQHLDIGRDLDLDAGLLSSDISSLDAVAFVKKVGEAFGVEVPPEEVANWKNLRDFAAFLDSSAS
ncbi:MAG: acyl carrier protein [Holophagales bacterium]|nr:acyl carrier protein [Holophagales bacterium]MYF06053.1 acyl carrier protein [Holophagales bacterium]MYJ24012.1 acyl carrier protein [Holophagales bacterium]